MIYLNQDFFSNFSAGSSADGNNLTIDLFANELSDLIVYNTSKLIDTLNKVDVKVNEKMSDEEIVDNVISGISGNEKIVKAIGFAIAENNGLVNTSNGNQIDWVKAVNSIVLGLTPASQEITKSDESKAVAKQKIMQQIQTKAKMKGDYARKIWKNESSGSYTALWVILGLAALGTVSYFIYKKMKVVSESPAINPNLLNPQVAAPVHVATPNVNPSVNPNPIV